MVIPIGFSIIYYGENVNLLKLAGIAIALIAVVLIIIRKQTGSINKRVIFLPVILFFGSGLVDTCIKIAQHSYVNEEILPVFSAILFSMAAIIGLTISIINPALKAKTFLNKKVLLSGILLGTSNLGSIWFLIHALNHSGFDSSVVFGINNVGIVGLSVVFALILFREKLTKLNWIGVGFSLIAIAMLSYS